VKQFIFSADSHIREPNTLFSERLPVSMRDRAIHAEHGDGFIQVRSGENIFHALRVRKAGEGQTHDLAQSKRKGASNLVGRLEDMELDGVDAEICFPELALWTYKLDDPELEFATTQIYNDWNNDFLSQHLNHFVRCGVLPVRDFKNTIFEMKRLAALGYTAAMLPVVTPGDVPRYTDPAWDEIFNTAGELGIVMVMHTGTGLDNVVVVRGPGGAVINYSRQMNDAVDTVMALTAGGVLDRNPKAQIALIESGASWLAAVAERMDEVYEAHAVFVRPKLSIMPSEIIKRQVHASFQHDRACIMSRSVTGVKPLLFATDYPHAEGTFTVTRDLVGKPVYDPDGKEQLNFTRDLVGRLFDGIDISAQDKADILGGNAARLFRFTPPAEFSVAAPQAEAIAG
jgi:predicted TIM-barrel fold metal-dependent hydrolase